MAEAFRNFKKNLWSKYLEKDKKVPPEFKGEQVKLKHQWAEFVAYKESEAAKKKSEKIRKMRQKRSITMCWGQAATRAQCISGKLWRPT